MSQLMRLLALFPLLCFANTFTTEQDCSLLLCLVSNGILRIETYTDATINSCNGNLDQDCRKEHTLLALNLNNKDCTVETTSSDNDSVAISLTTKLFTTKNVFTINIPALLDIATLTTPYNAATFAPWSHHNICNEEPPLIDACKQDTYFKVIYKNNDALATAFLTFDAPIQSICGIVLPNTVTKNTLNPIIMDVQEAVENHILIPTIHKQVVTDAVVDDALLNAMEQDGTFAVKKTSALMALLKSIGGKALVKYVALIESLSRMLNKIINLVSHNGSNQNAKPNSQNSNHGNQESHHGNHHHASQQESLNNSLEQTNQHEKTNA